MSVSLYDLSVPTFLQTVNALAGVLDRADEHCAKTGHDPEDFVEARLIDDMAPFHFQIEAACHHAVWGSRLRERALHSARTCGTGSIRRFARDDGEGEKGAGGV